MSDLGRKLVSHGSIYLLGNILNRGVSFIMLPIYTRYLTPADYGILELLSMMIDIVGIMLGLRISQAIFRFYNAYDADHQKNEVITSAMILIGALNLLGVLLIALFAKPLSFLVFDNAGAVSLLITFSFTLMFQALIEVPMVFLRARQKPILFVAFSTLKLLLQLSLNVYFLVVLGMKAEGVIYSAVIAGVIMSGILITYTLRITGLRFSVERVKTLISFSLPLMLTGLVSFFITFGDRYFLRYYSTLSEVGIYSLAYKFGFMLMFLIVEPFSNYWDSEKYNIMKKPNATQIYQETFLIYCAVAAVFTVLVSIFVKDLLRIIAQPSFWPAYQIAPVVMLAYLFNAGETYTDLGLYAANRTIEITYGTLIGAAVVGVGYSTLIPEFGPMGAAWATVCGFGSRFFWVTWRSQKLYNMKLPWRKVLVILLIGFAAYALSMLSPEKLVASLIFNALMAGAFLAALLLLPILPGSLRRSIWVAMFKPWKVPAMLKEAAGPNRH